MLLLVSLFRGGSSSTSIIGIKKCTLPDWILIALYIVLSPIITYVSLRIVRREYNLKVKYNKGLAPSDLKFTGSVLVKLLLISFIGGLVCGARGLGGGTVFNPVLISMGVPPKVSSATGKYMIMFSKASSSVVYLVYG